MKKLFAFLTFLVCLICTFYGVHAQKKNKITTTRHHKCLTNNVLERWKKKHPQYYDENKFERWITEERLSNQRVTDEVITIPVIFHIIHKGEPIGQGTNVSASQVASQLQVLNEDFRRQNADTVLTPSIFKGVAADIKIEFRLATVYPNGTPLEEAGIHRVKQSKSSALTDVEIDEVIKPATSFDPTRYLNVWVVDIADDLGSVILGYASFPEASGLIGVPPADLAEQDGVVINYRAFGSNYTGHGTFDLRSENDKGRTATHEIGHYLGLRHIWGDGGCDVDDFCEDTPLAGDAYEGNDCGLPTNTCGIGSEGDLPDMIQNYMDYSDDVCMNIFTNDQKFRMRTVMEKSPRRKELPSSNVAEPINPNNVFAYFTASSKITCVNSLVIFSDQSTAGANTTIDTWEWNFDVDGIGKALPSTSSSSGKQSVVYQQEGIYKISLTVKGKNGFASTYSQTIEVVAQHQVSLPYSHGFEENFPPTHWKLMSNHEKNWEKTNVGFQSSSSLMIDNYEEDLSEFDNLIIFTPFYSFSSQKLFQLSFDVAYAPYDDSGKETFDSLVIVYSTSCDGSYKVLRPLSRSELKTAAKTGDKFIPKNDSEWKKISFRISDFVNLPTDSLISFGFWNISNYGNVIYIDNFSIEEEGDKPPFVKKPIGTLNFPPNVPSFEINLLEVFDDDDSEVAFMTFQVLRNSNPNLITTIIEDKVLKLLIKSNTEGTANIDLEASSNGKKVVDKITVNVRSEFAQIARPTNITATMLNAQSVKIQWKDNSNDEKGFILERSTADEIFVSIKELPSNTSEYIDNEVFINNCELNRYRVFAYKDLVISLPSDTAQVLQKTKATVFNELIEEFTVDFPKNGWKITNPSSEGWKLSAFGANNSSYSYSIDNYTNDFTNQSPALLEFPVFDYHQAANITLSFEIAYALLQEDDKVYSDDFAIMYSTDCGITYHTDTLLRGIDLATAPNEGSKKFVPSAASDWKSFVISLNRLKAKAGSDNLRIAFANIGKYAQAFYIDNIRLTQEKILESPTQLIGLVRDVQTIRLLWKDNSQDETGFVVERSLSEKAGYQVIKNLGANVQEFDDTGLNINNIYYYRVRAIRNNSFSNYSNVIQITTHPNSNQEELSSTIEFYPNPSSGMLFINFQDESFLKSSHLQVFDLSGREMSLDKIIHEQNLISLNMRALGDGVYILKINTPKGAVYQRVIISK
ncbi:MAG: hypothetical protein OHK0038_01450 [Flammeovirgaceae bacterium]